MGEEKQKGEGEEEEDLFLPYSLHNAPSYCKSLRLSVLDSLLLIPQSMGIVTMHGYIGLNSVPQIPVYLEPQV